jgi:hypothetical protein
MDNDLKLPFFNDVEGDVKYQFGDVINSVTLHTIRHQKLTTINSHYKTVYSDFNNVRNEIINNTRNLFTKHKYLNSLKIRTIDEVKKENILSKIDIKNNENLDFFSYDSEYNKLEYDNLYILKYINKMNVRILNIHSEDLMFLCVDIKFYFPEIKIILCLSENLSGKNLILLNYIDVVYCNDSIIKNIKTKDILLDKNPKYIIN